MNLGSTISIGALFAASLLFGCGDGAQSNVQYSDAALIVDGIAYSRRTPGEAEFLSNIYEEGAVYVGEKPGQQAALDARLNELGLTDHLRYEVISHYVVRVPVGWEDQWVRALLAQSQVRYAWINFGFPCC